MKKFVFIGVPIVVLFVLVGWRYMQKTDTNKQLAARSSGTKNGPANVVLGRASAHEVAKTYEAVGSVEAPYAVELSPKLTGKIVYLPDEVREGFPLRTGQLLARIDPTETEGQVLQAKSALAQARANLMSAKFIQNPTDTNVESQIDQSNATVRSNQADYDQVRENYSAQVHQAHSAVIDSQAKVAAAKSATYNAEASKGSASATLANAQSKLNRETSLYKEGFVAAQDVDDAVAAEKVAEANVNVADGLVKSAKSAEISAGAALRSAEDNEQIVKKTGTTNIQAALEKVKLSKAALKYSVSTRSQKPAYLAQLDALQAAVNAAVGNLNQAEARLADCNLVSTIDGTVSKRSADVGTVVNAGNSILEIQYLKWLYITTAIPVDYSGIIVRGTPVTMTFDALPGVQLEATVTELSNVADPQSRQFAAKIRVDNAEGKFRPGMYAAVHFLVSKKSYPVVVNREAVHAGNDGVSTVTMVDSSNVAHIVPVTTGDQDTSHVVITSGLQSGDRVVLLSYTAVRDKQKVTEGGKPKGKRAAAATPDSANSDKAGTASGDSTEASGTVPKESPTTGKRHRNNPGTTSTGTSN